MNSMMVFQFPPTADLIVFACLVVVVVVVCVVLKELFWKDRE